MNRYSLILLRFRVYYPVFRNPKRLVLAAIAGKRMTSSQSLRSLLVQMSYVATWVAGIFFSCVIAFESLRLGDIVRF